MLNKQSPMFFNLTHLYMSVQVPVAQILKLRKVHELLLKQNEAFESINFSCRVWKKHMKLLENVHFSSLSSHLLLLVTNFPTQGIICASDLCMWTDVKSWISSWIMWSLVFTTFELLALHIGKYHMFYSNVAKVFFPHTNQWKFQM